MVAVEQNEQHADRGWEEQEPVFGEGVGNKEPTPVADANLVQLLVAVAVQRRKIDVGGRAVDAHVLVRRPEDTDRAPT